VNTLFCKIKNTNLKFSYNLPFKDGASFVSAHTHPHSHLVSVQSFFALRMYSLRPLGKEEVDKLAMSPFAEDTVSQ